jgi:hypothetical protein
MVIPFKNELSGVSHRHNQERSALDISCKQAIFFCEPRFEAQQTIDGDRARVEDRDPAHRRSVCLSAQAGWGTKSHGCEVG